MKKIFSLIAVLLAGSYGLAMAQVEVSAVADSTATTSAEDEYAFLFENTEVDYNEGIEKKWEYHMDLVFNTSSGTSSITSDESAGVNLGVGYNVTSWLYTGAAIGFLHDFGGTSGLSAGDFVPLLGEIQLRWNIRRKVSFFAQGRAGMIAPVTAGKKEVSYIHRDKDGTLIDMGEADFDYPSYVYYEVGPGFIYRVKSNIDLRVSVGYAYAKPFKESKHFEDRTYDETIIWGKFGFGYRF